MSERRPTTLDLLARIAARAQEDVGPEPTDDLAKREERRYATGTTADDDPTIPARTALKLRLEELTDYYAQRKRYIPKLFRFMVYWVIGLLVLVVLSGFDPPFSVEPIASKNWWWWVRTLVNWVISFQLSDPVLMSLVGGTTASVIGLFLVVARYLYPKDKTPDPHGF